MGESMKGEPKHIDRHLQVGGVIDLNYLVLND